MSSSWLFGGLILCRLDSGTTEQLACQKSMNIMLPTIIRNLALYTEDNIRRKLIHILGINGLKRLFKLGVFFQHTIVGND